MGALADGVVIGSAAIERAESLPPDGIESGMREWARWISGATAGVV
jgi:tryptophan synthase alpha subunit